MNSLCTSLADALRKANGKWTDNFEVHGKTFSMRHNEEMWYTQLDRLDDIDTFPLDFMDAVAAALGYEFDTRRAGIGAHEWLVYKSDVEYFADEGALYSENVYPDKRTASLAALLAIITHALEDGK